MRKRASKEQKSEWDHNYVQRRKDAGWKAVGWLLPADILAKVKAYKVELMEAYKGEK